MSLMFYRTYRGKLLTALILCLWDVNTLHAQEANSGETFSLPESEENPELEKIDQERDENLSSHRDIYIISGKPDTKVQLSFKLRVLKRTEIYLGYSQLMFWRLDKKSSPFEDVSYNPELFYGHPLGEGFFRYAWIGLDHRSNGKDGLESRSIDRVFTQIDNAFGIGNDVFKWSLRLFAFYDVDKTNRDFQKYSGFWETRLSVESLFDKYYVPLNSEIYVNFFPGGYASGNLLKGGTEIGIKVRVRMFGLLPYVLAQAYYGHSESLISYNEKIEAYRIGFLF
jgi:phospholipase A1/A2